jgi:dipeptidyl aminopeptidase/acylaminoacyl peptidase
MRSILCVLALVLMSSPAAAQQAPVEAYGRLPAIDDAAISPDGVRLALAVSVDGQSQVRAIDLERGAIVYAAAVDEESTLQSVDWIDDQRVSYLLRRTFHPGSVLPGYIRYSGAPRRVDFYRYGFTDLERRRSQILTVNEDNPWQDQGARLIAPIEGDQGYVRMIGRAPGMATRRPIIYRVLLSTGGVRGIDPPGSNADTIDYLLDERGALVARVDSDERTNAWRVVGYEGDAQRVLAEGVNETGEPIRLVGLLPDGRIAAFDWDEAGEFSVLYAIDRATGAREVFYQREGAEIDNAVRDPWTRRVVGVAWTATEYEQHFFDAELSAIYGAVKAQFPTGTVTLVNWSRDRNRVVVYGERGLDGGAYYVYNTDARELRRVAPRYPELAGVAAGERQSVNYRARDGVRIPGYLTLPPGREARNLPLIVLVHGGPAGRDTFDFDWWAAFLASRGYAVLQPNFRGSGGYGASWERAGVASMGALDADRCRGWHRASGACGHRGRVACVHCRRFVRWLRRARRRCLDAGHVPLRGECRRFVRSSRVSAPAHRAKRW